MKKLIAIGEAVIDFIPLQTGCKLSEVSEFHPTTGGAPGNVCVAFSRLNGEAELITQLGLDAFGDKIVKELNGYGVDTSHVLRTDSANTSLAFVSLEKDGSREFSFYRKPGADMLLSPDCVEEDWFRQCGILHFCSVSLGDTPMMYSHKKAIRSALSNGAIISFDPNVRLPLWQNHDDLRKRILEFLPYAHVLKISDEELEFISGYKTIEDALPTLMTGNVKLVIYTAGAGGAYAYTKQASAYSEGLKVNAIDTTGAGDAFIGSFLSQMAKKEIGVDEIVHLDTQTLKQWLDFSNRYCAYSVTKSGGPSSYPKLDELKI